MASGKFIRGAVIGLPIGLFFLGIASMLYTQLKPDNPEDDPNYRKRLEAASLNRRKINRGDLEKYIKILSSEIGERHMGRPGNLERTAIWLESTLKGGNLGFQVNYHVYPVDGVEVRNIVAELTGRGRRNEIVVIGAHYDTVPNCPGANDNGTGVAAVLALARAFAGAPQDRTIRFVFFVNEEPPYFQTENMGSLAYARKLASRGEKVTAMLSIDSIGFFTEKPGSQSYPGELANRGFPGAGNFLAFVANDQSRYWADSARKAFMIESGIAAISGAFPEGIPGIGWSDQWSFWQAGYPAVMVTDTAPYRYPHYHKPTDTYDKIDFEKLEKACLGLQSVVRTWANPD